MHLFALLIAAVFSSQFVAPNGDIPSFTLTPASISRSVIATLPAFVTNLVAATYDNVTGYVALTADAAPTAAVIATTDLEDTGDLKWTIKAGLDISALAVTAETPSLWFFLKQDTQTPVKFEVKFERGWIMESDDIDEDTYTIKNIVVSPPIPKWAVTATADNDKVTIYVSTAAQADPTDPDPAWLGSAVSAKFTAGTYAIESLPITSQTLAGEDTLYFYVAYVNTAGTAAFDATAVEIELPASAAKYTISPTTLPLNQVDIFTSITITPGEDVVLGDEITVKITATDGTGAVTVTAEEEADGNYVATIDTAAFKNLKALNAANTYKVEVKTEETGEKFLKGTRTLSLAAAANFIAAPTKVEVKDWIATKTITLTKNADSNANWAAAVDIVLSPSGYRTAFDNTKDIAINAQTPDQGVLTFALNAAMITKFPATAGTRLFIYVANDKATLNADPPVFVDVIANIPLFTIDPPELESDDLKEPIAFELTPKVGHTWTPDNMEVTFTLTTTKPTGETIPFTFPLTAPGGGKQYTVTANLATLAVVDETTNIYAWVAKSKVYDNEYIAIPYQKTVVEPTFTISPAYVLFADIASIAALEVVPDMAVTWTGPVTITFTYTAPAPSNTPVTLTVTKNGQNKWMTAASQSLAALGLVAGDIPATLEVTLTADGTTLQHKASFQVLNQAPPTPTEATFTIAPVETTWAATLSTPIITFTPSTGHGWPAAAKTGFKAVLSFGTKTAIDAPMLVSTATPPVYTIAATALAGFEIKEADCPAAIKIKVNDGTKLLAHEVTFTVKKKAADAAMGVSPLVSLLAALVFLFVKLF